jgi:hypothetical protein
MFPPKQPALQTAVQQPYDEVMVLRGQDNLYVPFMPSYVLTRSPSSVCFRLTSLQQTPIFLYFRPFCLERFLNNGLSGLSPACSQ